MLNYFLGSIITAKPEENSSYLDIVDGLGSDFHPAIFAPHHNFLLHIVVHSDGKIEDDGHYEDAQARAKHPPKVVERECE